MEPILTGVFIVALHKATELQWKKGFFHWAGTGAGSRREAASAQVADLAGMLATRRVYHA
jgi:hypothetical protein